jgi:hypothetical protein
MLQSNARPAFLTACACNLTFAVTATLAFEGQHLIGYIVSLVGGGLAAVAAIGLGITLLIRDEGIRRRSVKAAIVFLVLGPLAFWGLYWPATLDAACVQHCYTEWAVALQARALGDVVQSQIAMIAIAFAALLCATKATTAPLEELAV